MSSAQTRRLARVIVWLGFGAIAVARVAVQFAGLDPATENALADVLAYLIPIALTSVLLLVVSFATLGLAEHRLWGTLTLASILILIAESHWTWYVYTVDPHGPDVTAPPQLLHVVAVLLFFAGAASITRFPQQRGLVRLRLLLDACAVACAVWALVLAFVSGPALLGIDGGGLDAALIIAAYPVAGLGLVISAFLAFVGWKPRRMRTWEALMAGALSLSGLGLLVMPSWYPAVLTADEFGPSWFMVLLGASFWLLAVTAVYRLTAPASEAIAEPWAAGAGMPRWAQWVLPVVLMLLVPVLAVGATHTAEHPVSSVLIVAAAVIAILLVLRSAVSALIAAGFSGPSQSEETQFAINRDGYDAELQACIERVREPGGLLAVVVFTIASRARFDSALGHSIGDEESSRVAAIIAETFGPSVSVHRIRVNRIAVICEGASGFEAASLARRAWLRIRSDREGEELGSGLSAGVAVYPEHGTNADLLTASAQTACLRAAGSEAEPVEVYSSADEQMTRDELVDRARARTLRETIRALARAVDERSPVTTGHSENVSELAAALAQVLDLPDRSVHTVGLAALMHDVGKVGVRDEIVTKRGLLSAEERGSLEEHAVLGARILEQAGFTELLPAVRHHHECWDGSGYPDGLMGSQIPLEARILAVSNDFECLTAGRTVSEPLSAEQALAIIRHGSGTTYDPAVSGAFVRMIERLRAVTVAS